MSWQDQLATTKLEITTGNGLVWQPKWKPKGKIVEMNNTIYDYPQLRGSFVDRRESKGDKYQFLIVFEGELCIENSESFLNSAKDKRAWTVIHPYYGTLTVQPIRLSIDNSSYNVSQISIECVDTLLSEQQFTERELRGELLELSSLLSVSVSTTYTNALNIPKASDSSLMLDSVSTWDHIQSLAIKTKRELGEFKALVNTATSATENLISDATSAINQFNTLIEFPFRVRSRLQDRFNTFTEQYDRAKSTLSEFSGGTKSTPARDKYFFACQTASLIATSCLVCTLEPDAEPNEEDSEETLNYTIEDDYTKRSELVTQIEEIKAFYAQFLEDSDALETDRADDESSYHLNDSVSFTLNQIVATSIRNLEDQIFGALQERTYKVPADSNIVVLAHRLLGFQSSDADEKIQKVIDENGIGLNELVGVKKDKELTYYV